MDESEVDLRGRFIYLEAMIAALLIEGTERAPAPHKFLQSVMVRAEENIASISRAAKDVEDQAVAEVAGGAFEHFSKSVIAYAMKRAERREAN